MKDWQAAVRTWESNDVKPIQNGSTRTYEPKYPILGVKSKLENAMEIYAETDAILREELRKSEENG